MSMTQDSTSLDNFCFSFKRILLLLWSDFKIDLDILIEFFLFSIAAFSRTCSFFCFSSSTSLYFFKDSQNKTCQGWNLFRIVWERRFHPSEIKRAYILCECCNRTNLLFNSFRNQNWQTFLIFLQEDIEESHRLF